MSQPAPSSQQLFGGFTLPEMMRALSQVAITEAMGIEALEIWAAAEPDPVKEHSLEEVRNVARAVVAARALLVALAPHEAALHALVYSEGRPS